MSSYNCLSRYMKKDNLYLKTIIKQPKMIFILRKNRVEEINENESLSLDYKIFGKNIFPFVLTYKGNKVGIVCLDNIDWENKNCSMKCGIFEEAMDLLDSSYIKDCFKEVLNFSYSSLGIVRVEGILKNQDFGCKDIEGIFKKEGETSDRVINYYAHFVEI